MSKNQNETFDTSPVKIDKYLDPYFCEINSSDILPVISSEEKRKQYRPDLNRKPDENSLPIIKHKKGLSNKLCEEHSPKKVPAIAGKSDENVEYLEHEEKEENIEIKRSISPVPDIFLYEDDDDSALATEQWIYYEDF
ncbi:hypothetical protein SNEBB_010918 [Seison nebaliae]|nr:hypothetical protein SNEBB_010918 [Seison nebaliae]